MSGTQRTEGSRLGMDIAKKRKSPAFSGNRTRRDEQRRKYSKMDKRGKDKLVRSPRENGGG